MEENLEEIFYVYSGSNYKKFTFKTNIIEGEIEIKLFMIQLVEFRKSVRLCIVAIINNTFYWKLWKSQGHRLNIERRKIILSLNYQWSFTSNSLCQIDFLKNLLFNKPTIYLFNVLLFGWNYFRKLIFTVWMRRFPEPAIKISYGQRSTMIIKNLWCKLSSMHNAGDKIHSTVVSDLESVKNGSSGSYRRGRDSFSTNDSNSRWKNNFPLVV